MIPSYGLTGAAMAMTSGRVMRMATLNIALALETRDAVSGDGLKRDSATDDAGNDETEVRRAA
jgi:hypothetical protein